MAQETATLNSIVTDPSNGAVPGVALSITNAAATGIVPKSPTQESGHYVFSALPPGRYSLEFKKVGFQTTVTSDVELHLADRNELKVQLAISAITQTVTVTTSVNTADGAVSHAVDRHFEASLPLNGTTFQSPNALTRGVVVTTTATGNVGQFSMNGMRSDDNYFTIDGVSANLGVQGPLFLNQAGEQLPAPSAVGGTNSLVSIDAMEEFRIETSTFAPEFGRLPGGQVDIVTTSGTNQFHGTAFDYLPNDVLNANECFANRAGLARAKERENDFGGVLGEPIIKNKPFFFFSREGQRMRQPLTIDGLLPSLAVRAVVPPSQAVFVAALPLPTGPGLADGSTPSIATASNEASLDGYSIKADHRLTKGLSVSGRYNRSPSSFSPQGLASISTTRPAVSAVCLRTGIVVAVLSLTGVNLVEGAEVQTPRQVAPRFRGESGVDSEESEWQSKPGIERKHENNQT